MTNAALNPRELLTQMFRAAVAVSHPENGVPLYLPQPPAGKMVVIGAGKASAAMARVVERHWPEARSGVVVTR